MPKRVSRSTLKKIGTRQKVPALATRRFLPKVVRYFLLREGDTSPLVRATLLKKACDTGKVSRDISQEGVRHSSSVVRHFSRRRVILYSIVRHSFYGRAILYQCRTMLNKCRPYKTKTLQELEKGQTHRKSSTSGSTGSTF